MARRRAGAPDAEQRLNGLITDRGRPAIVRASAVALLAPYATARSEAAVKAAIADPDPLVRAAAPRIASAAASPALVEALAPLLGDAVRAVRIEGRARSPASISAC